MGIFLHPLTIIGPSGRETVEAQVDTSIIFAVIPAPILERLGVRPLDARPYHGAFVGQVEGRLGGERGWPMVVPGAETDQPVIGRHTLDSFILDIDEEVGTLVPKVLRVIEHAH